MTKNADDTYSGVHISWHELFLAGNQGNHQSLVPSMLPYKWPTQKTQNSANSQYFFTKISGIGPWASRINLAFKMSHVNTK